MLFSSQGLPYAYIRLLLGEFFHLWFFEVEGADFGMNGSGRPRVYIVAANKFTGCVLGDLMGTWAVIRDRIKSGPSTTPSSYMFASEADILIEAMRVAAMRKIEYRSEPLDAFGLF